MSKRLMFVLIITAVFIAVSIGNFFFPQVEGRYAYAIAVYVWLVLTRKNKWWYFAFELTLSIIAMLLFFVQSIEVKTYLTIGFLVLLTVYVIIQIVQKIKARKELNEKENDESIDN